VHKTRVTKFCAVVPKIAIAFFLLIQKYLKYARVQHKAPDSSGADMSIQNCESSVWDLLHVTLLAPTNFIKFMDTLFIISTNYSMYLYKVARQANT
jgi:hypothetical protein